jgi:hypothetical protein
MFLFFLVKCLGVQGISTVIKCTISLLVLSAFSIAMTTRLPLTSIFTHIHSHSDYFPDTQFFLVWFQKLYQIAGGPFWHRNEDSNSSVHNAASQGHKTIIAAIRWGKETDKSSVTNCKTLNYGKSLATRIITLNLTLYTNMLVMYESVWTFASYKPTLNLKANSHTPCYAHAAPLPSHAVRVVAENIRTASPTI